MKQMLHEIGCGLVVGLAKKESFNLIMEGIRPGVDHFKVIAKK